MRNKKMIVSLPLKIFLLALSFFVLIPIVWLIVSGFKYESDIISWPPTFFAKTFTLENWTTIRERIDIVL